MHFLFLPVNWQLIICSSKVIAMTAKKDVVVVTPMHLTHTVNFNIWEYSFLLIVFVCHSSVGYTLRLFYLHVSVLSRLFVLLKYCGFSITGILVMPMITASGPISEDDGVLLPLETWWRGEAESSSLLITEDGPRRAERCRIRIDEFRLFILSLQWSRKVLHVK